MNNNKQYEESLGKAIKEAIGDDLDSLDFYKDIKYIEPDLSKYQGKYKPHHYRHMAIAAAVLVIFILSRTFAVIISNGTVSASKFKIEQQLIKLKNIFIGGNENKYQETAEGDHIVLEIKSQDDMKKAKEFFPNLFVSDKIPQRFTFDSLTIIKLPNGIYKAYYVYSDNNGSLLTINQESIPEEGLSTSIINSTNKIAMADGDIYISENPFGDGANTATYITDNFIIDINGMIEVDEITDILNKQKII